MGRRSQVSRSFVLLLQTIFSRRGFGHLWPWMIEGSDVTYDNGIPCESLERALLLLDEFPKALISMSVLVG